MLNILLPTMSYTISPSEFAHRFPPRPIHMNLQIESSGDVKIVRIKEDKLVYPKLNDFFGQVSGLVESGTGKLIIDLSDVSYIDSASIGCLMDIYRLMSERSGSLKLVGLQERVETMVSLTGLHNLVDVYREEKNSFGELLRDARDEENQD